MEKTRPGRVWRRKSRTKNNWGDFKEELGLHSMPWSSAWSSSCLPPLLHPVFLPPSHPNFCLQAMFQPMGLSVLYRMGHIPSSHRVFAHAAPFLPKILPSTLLGHPFSYLRSQLKCSILRECFPGHWSQGGASCSLLYHTVNSPFIETATICNCTFISFVSISQLPCRCSDKTRCFACFVYHCISRLHPRPGIQ